MYFIKMVQEEVMLPQYGNDWDETQACLTFLALVDDQVAGSPNMHRSWVQVGSTGIQLANELRTPRQKRSGSRPQMFLV